jgi:hypothetical protein
MNPLTAGLILVQMQLTPPGGAPIVDHMRDVIATVEKQCEVSADMNSSACQQWKAIYNAVIYWKPGRDYSKM